MPIKLSPNELIRDRHFLVSKVDKKQTRSGDDFYILELKDPEGAISGTIWNNNISQCNFEIGKIIELNGKTQEYNGKLSIIIDKCQVVESEEASNYSPVIPTMIFDIETVGKKFDDLDEKEQYYILNNLNKDEEDVEVAKSKTALWSLFGFVAAIGCFDPDRKKGTVLVISDKELIPESENYTYKIFSDEKSLLQEFWKITTNFEKFVTYNGESFDFPYLINRSGINRVKVPIEIKRWSDNFIDLQQKFKQSNRSFKLEMLCKVFGVENPKEAGVDGSQVGELYYNKEFQKIADYVSRDAYSTAELYKVWKEFMSGGL